MREAVRRKVTGTTACTVADRGQACELTLFFEDGSKETLELPIRALPILVASLAQAGREAAILRSGEALDLVAPFHVKEITRIGLDLANGSFAVEIALTEGFPLILLMSQRQVTKTINALQQALVQKGSSPQTRRN